MTLVLLVVAISVAAARVEAQTPQTPPPQTPPPQTAPAKPPTAQPPTTKPQRRVAKTATLAILVTGPDGTQIPNVSVTVEGPASRTVRTEGGRIALEEMPIGNYRLRFDREGYVPLERELTARAGAPMDVKVTLTPMPEPPAPPPPPPPPPSKPPSNAKPASFDVTAVIEKEFVGRGAGKTTPLACGGDGSATLIQVNDPVSQHAHNDADEFLYVVAGEGSASLNGAQQKLHAGVLLFIPRGAPHAFTRAGRNPLFVVSTRAGEGCGA